MASVNEILKILDEHSGDGWSGDSWCLGESSFLEVAQMISEMSSVIVQMEPVSIKKEHYPKVKYSVWTFNEDNSPELNIDGEGLAYAQLGDTHRGLQCNLLGDDPKYKEILSKCVQVVKLFKEIEELNNGKTRKRD